jgi:hypothetical protein
LGGTAAAVVLEPIKIKIRPSSDWLTGPPVGVDDFEHYLNRYHDNLPPGRLLHLLKSAVAAGVLKTPSILSFFAYSFQDREDAREAASALFPSLDPKMKLAVAISFRLGGLDTSAFTPGLSADMAETLKSIEQLKDPRKSMNYQDPISIDTVRGLGATMDECWGGWMATGDRTFLRALVALLGNAPDFPVFQSWVKNRGGEKGLNASVARGLAYQIAGWSIGAFQRADPHVSDWIIYWKADPDFPPDLRRELASVLTNPAFRRK